MCGEHNLREHQVKAFVGSSPRVWGTPDSTHALTAPRRFIPTCVGNTTLTPFREIDEPVHPHVCGEHDRYDASVALRDGSSPRVWGTRNDGKIDMLLLRFIPTCVGNTRYPKVRNLARTVHPHVCGEHVSL